MTASEGKGWFGRVMSGSKPPGQSETQASAKESQGAAPDVFSDAKLATPKEVSTKPRFGAQTSLQSNDLSSASRTEQVNLGAERAKIGTRGKPAIEPSRTSRLAATAPESATASAVAVEDNLVKAVTELGRNATHTQVFRLDLAPHSVAPGLEHSLVADDAGFARLRLAKGDPEAPSYGFTGGYSLRVPDAVEKEASGHVIKVRLLARALNGGKGSVSCAYSTNDVGNSGWQVLEFGPIWEIKSFEYSVPRMKRGNGDYVGLLAKPEDEPTVEVAGFAIEVVS